MLRLDFQAFFRPTFPQVPGLSPTPPSLQRSAQPPVKNVPKRIQKPDRHRSV
jgi:hypothetical protein